MLSDIVSVFFFDVVIFFLVSEVLEKRKIFGTVYDCGTYTFGDTVFHNSSETGERGRGESHHTPPSIDMHTTTAYK